MLILSLALNELRQRKVRSALTVAAVAMAVSLVIAMTGGFASLRATAYQVLGGFYGQMDVLFAPQEQRGVLLSESLAQFIAADPRVQLADPRLVTDATLQNRGGGILGAFTNPSTARLVGIRVATAPAVTRFKLESGEWFTQTVARVCVIDVSTAERLKLKVGGNITLPSPDGPIRFRITGLLAKPSVMQIDTPTIYMPLGTLQSLLNQPGRVNRIEVDLKPGQDVAPFITDIQHHLPPRTPPLDARTVDSQKQKFDRSFQGIQILSYLGGTVSMIAAAFIIFSTLSMGISERSRILAMLRAIGAVRRQVAALVIIEALILATLGALLGIAVGWIALTIVAAIYPALFAGGAVLSAGGITYGIAGSLAAALIASLLPAWSASRVDALEAMTAVGRPTGRFVPRFCAIAGLLLLTIDPMIVHMPGLEAATRIQTHVFFGAPCLFVGLFLIAPMFVLIVERLFGGLVAKVMRVEPALLRQQLSSGLWRSAGTAAALMVGLAVLVLIQTHGRSMIRSWQLPDKFPDMLMLSFIGLDDEQLVKLQNVHGIRERGILPVYLASPKLSTKLFGDTGLVDTPDATILFGIDPDRAFGTEDPPLEPMIELDFVEGDQVTARKLLKQGHAVLVSQEFKKNKNLSVGQTLKLQTPLNGEVEYRIAGVIRSSGVDMIVRLFDMEREFQQWTAASAVTTAGDLRRDFGNQRVHLVAANLAPGLKKDLLVEAVRMQLRVMGLKSADARTLKAGIDNAMVKLLDFVSVVGLLAIIVAAVGVMNTIVAGIRSRRWQLGVLRSIGLTRGALLRMILAEAMLIGLIATALGIFGGLLLSFVANGIARHILGSDPVLAIYWPALYWGTGITLAVTLLASLWPAIRVCFTDTLNLLQAGRAAA